MRNSCKKYTTAPVTSHIASSVTTKINIVIRFVCQCQENRNRLRFKHRIILQTLDNNSDWHWSGNQSHGHCCNVSVKTWKSYSRPGSECLAGQFSKNAVSRRPGHEGTMCSVVPSSLPAQLPRKLRSMRVFSRISLKTLLITGCVLAGVQERVYQNEKQFLL